MHYKLFSVPDCPLEIHPDTETMFIMRNPLGDPEPRTCPPGTYFLRSVCSCVNRPLDSKGMFNCHIFVTSSADDSGNDRVYTFSVASSEINFILKTYLYGTA